MSALYKLWGSTPKSQWLSAIQRTSNIRMISQSRILNDRMPNLPPSSSATAENINPQQQAYPPTNLEKRFLVWSGKYKTYAEVPELVSHEALEKARSKARIKIANYMMVATIIGCFLMVISGKNAAARGESVQKMNLEWHRHIKEDAIREAEEAKAQELAAHK